ncbi:MAG: S-layer homology domain-containing protein [Clostridiales bacterium]|jgi:hypothetical protein|nr:S-layer homology domain-containing protein [Clostridiales bacterium]
MCVSAVFAADTVLDEQVTVPAPQAESGFADANAEKAFLVLSGYGIVKGYEDGTIRPDESVTRAEFTAMLCRVLGVDLAGGGVPKFHDVPRGHWAYDNISAAFDLEIINGVGGGAFAPEETVTYTHAYKMLTAALGYTNAAEAAGGYPSGYLMTAFDLGLRKNVSAAGENASRGDLFIMLYNALSVDLMLATTTDGTGSQVFRERTLLRGLRGGTGLRLIEGVVNTVGLSSMVGVSTLRGNQVEIDGMVCESELRLNPYAYLGRSVIAFAEERDGEADQLRLVSASLTPGQNAVTLFDAADIESYAAYRYKIDTEAGRETILIDPAACLIYNGAGVAEVTAESFAARNGTVQLIDNNRDGDVDVVFITEYQSYVVRHTDAANRMLYFRGDHVISQQSMEIRDDDARRGYYFIDRKGGTEFLDASGAAGLIQSAARWKEEDFARFAEGDVVTVLWDEAQNATVLILSDNTVVGRVTEVDYTSGGIAVDGLPYRLFKYSEGAYSVAYDDLRTRYDITYYIDVFGTVVGVDTTEVKRETPTEETAAAHGYAYILKARQRGTLGPVEIQFIEGVKAEEKASELYMNDDLEIAERTFDADIIKAKPLRAVQAVSNVYVNGARTNNAADIPTDTVAEYWMNADGKLTRIDALDEADFLDRYYNRALRSFSNRRPNGAFLADEDTLYFVVSTTAVTPEDYEVEFSMANGGLFTIGAAGTKLLFSNGIPVALTAVIRTPTRGHQHGVITDTTPATIVTKTTAAVDAEGEVVRKIYGHTDGMAREYLFRSDTASDVMEGLQTGDLAQLSIDADGKVDGYRKIVSLAALDAETPWFRAEARGKFERVFGIVYDTEEALLDDTRNRLYTRLSVAYQEDYGNITHYKIAGALKRNFYVYDTTQQEPTARLANFYDAIGVMNGADNAALVFVRLRFGEPQTIVLLKR